MAAEEFFMNVDRKRKLELNRLTIRALSAREMKDVAGGAYNLAVAVSRACEPMTSRSCPGTIGCKLAG
jgi:natural product precursor